MLYKEAKIIAGLGMLVDITERKKAEEELKRINQKINEIIDNIQEDFYVLYRDWNFAYASRTFTSRTGNEPKNFVGQTSGRYFQNISAQFSRRIYAQ